jgi:hypothetical protein
VNVVDVQQTIHPVAQTWYTDDGEAEVVRRLIFRLYLDERIGSRRISVELNRRSFRRRGGYAWSPVKIDKIVNNPAVAGLTSCDEEAYTKGLPSRASRWRQTVIPANTRPSSGGARELARSCW